MLSYLYQLGPIDGHLSKLWRKQNEMQQLTREIHNY